MPKIVTAKRREGEVERARLYLKGRLMFPTIPLGMVALLAGYGGVALMWFQDELTPGALLGSTLLFFFGVTLGWCHVRYERYLVKAYPEYLARKQKLLDAAKEFKRSKRDLPNTTPDHAGRRLVLIAYALGACAQFGVGGYYLDQVGVYPAFFLPWAGYFIAKVIFWRDLFAS